MAHFAPRIEHDDEETVTRPLIRPQPYLLRAPADTDPSIELEWVTEPEDITEPNRWPPLASDEEEWMATNELPRLPHSSELTITEPRVAPPHGERPLPLVKRREPSLPSLPPLSAPRAASTSRPVLPPIPAFTRPIAVALPEPPRPIPVPTPTTENSVVEVREDLRVEWSKLDQIPTTPHPMPAPHVYRPRLETVRGLDLLAVYPAPEIRYVPAAPEPSVVVDPRAELVSEARPIEHLQRNPISDIPPCAFAAPAGAPARVSGVRELLRAAKTDIWTAFLVLPIAVSLVSIVVITVTAIVSRSGSTDYGNRRIVSATDASGNAITDANVFVDGVSRCQSLPCAFDLEPGTHWVSVGAAGYDAPPARAVVTDSRGPRQIDFVLSRHEPERTGPQRVAGIDAPSAPLLGATAVAAQLVAPPEPTPAAVAPRTRTKRVSTPRTAAEPSVVRSYEDAPGVALLNINSIPASNAVLDGRPLGRTPIIGVRVEPGPHTVVFIDGKRRVARGTSVAAGKTAVVAARF